MYPQVNMAGEGGGVCGGIGRKYGEDSSTYIAYKVKESEVVTA